MSIQYLLAEKQTLAFLADINPLLSSPFPGLFVKVPSLSFPDAQLQISPEQSDRRQNSPDLAVINHTMLIALSCSDDIRGAGADPEGWKSVAVLSQFLSDLEGGPKGLSCSHETEF